MSFIQFSASAQNSPSNDLIKQGVDLHNQGKYPEAIDKFNEVLKTDPENSYANYELAFSLYTFKKPKDAIPHLEKAVKTENSSLKVAVYCLLATIYDEDNQAQKAFDNYNEAIKINPDYPQIFYNQGIAYFRNKQYADAENSAIEAIKHNPRNASSQRLYALVCFHQNKRANALLGFCSFLLLEPTGQRADEAYNNIQHIIQGGVLKDNNGATTIPVSTNGDQETTTLNTSISLVVAAAQTKKLTGMDLLEYELKSIFTMAGQLAENKSNKNFFDKFFAAYLYKLAQSENMPTFTRTASISANRTENVQWLKDHPQQLTALSEWIKKTERPF
ncbi:MAG TPA: tetratricopeptide repeat protein [Mucilaginibacter sp.]